MCDLDLSISKVVCKVRVKNDYRTKKQQIFEDDNKKREVCTSLSFC